jgi:hypothetical protein
VALLACLRFAPEVSFASTFLGKNGPKWARGAGMAGRGLFGFSAVGFKLTALVARGPARIGKVQRDVDGYTALPLGFLFCHRVRESALR